MVCATRSPEGLVSAVLVSIRVALTWNLDTDFVAGPLEGEEDLLV